jgi:hypothetical protein
MFDLIDEARVRARELEVRTLEISQRMQWYDARTIDRLERELRTARSRLQLPVNLATEAR